MTKGHGAKPCCSLAVKKTQVKIFESKDSNPVLANCWLGAAASPSHASGKGPIFFKDSPD